MYRTFLAKTVDDGSRDMWDLAVNFNIVKEIHAIVQNDRPTPQHP
ncbi:hypothetical protein [Dermatophilus congolensis]|nr:hypothetical protein [Dermatophilus congolensis]